MEWKIIRSENDIKELMEICGGFHDTCIVSLNYTSGEYVDDEQAMHFSEPDNHELTVLFHSQWNPKAFELNFTGVRQIHLAGWQEYYENDIFEASLSFFSGLMPGVEKVIVWADSENFDPYTVYSARDRLQEPANTYIVANGLQWRIVE